MKLSIVVPCYNESENIPLVLEEFSKIIKREDIELILVDNNSSDDTKRVLNNLLDDYFFARSVFQEIPGYGATIQKGIEVSGGEFVCWTHADLQTPPEDTLKALEMIEKSENPKKNFLKGRRYGRPFFDNFFTLGMSIFESLILGKILYDINAQPNLFHRSFLGLMKNPPLDFSFDLYAYYLAKKNGFKIVRFPVEFPERIHGFSKWNFSFESKMKFIKRTIDYSFKLKRNMNN